MTSLLSMKYLTHLSITIEQDALSSPIALTQLSNMIYLDLTLNKMMVYRRYHRGTQSEAELSIVLVIARCILQASQNTLKHLYLRPKNFWGPELSKDCLRWIFGVADSSWNLPTVAKKVPTIVDRWKNDIRLPQLRHFGLARFVIEPQDVPNLMRAIDFFQLVSLRLGSDLEELTSRLCQKRKPGDFASLTALLLNFSTRFDDTGAQTYQSPEPQLLRSLPALTTLDACHHIYLGHKIKLSDTAIDAICVHSSLRVLRLHVATRIYDYPILPWKSLERVLLACPLLEELKFFPALSEWVC